PNPTLLVFTLVTATGVPNTLLWRRNPLTQYRCSTRTVLPRNIPGTRTLGTWESSSMTGRSTHSTLPGLSTNTRTRTRATTRGTGGRHTGGLTLSTCCALAIRAYRHPLGSLGQDAQN